MSTSNERYESALKSYKEHRGKDYAPARLSSEPENIDEFKDLYFMRCYGDTWSRPGLDMRTRSLMTMCILAAIGADEQLKGHIESAHNVGITKAEMVEWLIHLNSYLGTPKSMIAFNIARQVWKEMETQKSSAP